jgi:DNA invertase Pin-like site-specific DNA recombinase
VVVKHKPRNEGTDLARVEPEALAYSYLRYSHPDQRKGNTVQRQTEARDAWLEAHPGVVLDTELRMSDEGRSGFRRKKWDTYALAEFVEHVKAGRVLPGSYLLVENLDRLSREEVGEATELFLSIVNRGVVVVQLSPVVKEFRRPVNGYDLMFAIMELSRGHGESAIKSKRLTAVWGTKKGKAREAKSVETTRTPAWLTVVGRRREGKWMVGGKFKIIPERDKVVLHIFRWAVAGLGLAAIVKRLTAEGVTPWTEPRKDKHGTTRGGRWTKAYVRKILTSRAALGEYQPRKNGKPEDDSVPGYYPRVPGLTEELWQKAQDALAGRRDRPGSPGKRVANLFSGLLWDARSRSRMLIAWQTRGGTGRRQKARVLVSADSMEGRGPTVSFPHQVFEEGLLVLLAEVDPAALGNGQSEEVAALEGEVERLRGSVDAIMADLDAHGDSPLLLARLRQRETLLAEKSARLAEARRREHNPPAAAMASAHPLLTAARDEEKRSRLKQLLRAAIESIWVLVVPHKVQRVAAVQVCFVGGVTRSYATLYKAAGRGREGGWWSRSFAEAGLPQTYDLRKVEHLQRLEATLVRHLKGAEPWPE